MSAPYIGAVAAIVIDPSGLNITVTGKLLRFATALGATPAEFIVEWLDKVPASTFNVATYLGKSCTLSINSVLQCTGSLVDIDLIDDEDDVAVLFSVVDYRHKINAGYVGQNFLETLDTSSPSSPTWGVPTTFANGLPFYGADIVFNKDGLPNQDLSTVAFVPPGYEHSEAFGRFWTFGSALEWLWQNCILPITGIAVPLVGGQTPSLWTFGGMDQEMPRLGPLLAVPLADAVDKILEQTRAQWTFDSTGTPIFFAIGQYTATETWQIPSPGDSPTTDKLTTPFGVHIKHSIRNAVGQLDIIGGKQQREVKLGSTFSSGSLSTSDFTQTTWLGLETNGNWNNFTTLTPGLGTSFQNCQVNVYLQEFYARFNVIVGSESTYRYNMKTSSVLETHKIGRNYPNENYQPPQMLSTLLIARDKNGNYVNPDNTLAYDSVSPQELLTQQYPLGQVINTDRGFILGRGVGPIPPAPIGSVYSMLPMVYSLTNPVKFTVAFECGYRAYQSVISSVSGAAYQVRRAILRDDLIHKTRESTEVIMPMRIDFGTATWSVTEFSTVPTGVTRNYSTSGPSSSPTLPLDPLNMTLNLPAGTIVDAMSELGEVAATVAPYVGIRHVDGSFFYPTFKALKLGASLLDPSGTYSLTGNEIITAMVFDDESQKFEIQFTDRLGRDITELAQQFVDARPFRRAP